MLDKNDIRVWGFPRSGTNYLAALVAKNFFNDDDYTYLREKRVHQIPSKRWIPLNRKLNIYIWRDFYPVSLSIFGLRERFNLEVKSYTEFMYSNLYDIVDIKKKGNSLTRPVSVNFGKHKDILTKRGNTFPRKQIPLIQHWSNHVTSWYSLSQTRSDIFIIRYEDLTDKFNLTMQQIAERLDDDKKKFKNIKPKVGWYIERETQ